MSAPRPRIGITSGRDPAAWGPEGPSWRAYADAVARAGGEPVHLSAAGLGEEPRAPAGLEALLLTGGGDVDVRLFPNPPDLQGEDPEEYMARHRMTCDPIRDRYELALAAEALQRDLPVLGICRGCQVLNLALGGRLILDLPLEPGIDGRHAPGPPPERPSGRHGLQVVDGTLLAAVLPPDRHPECNSRHHQAVRVDEHFRARVAAISPEDGVVEAIEVPGRRWSIGVQWHPEHPGDPWVVPRFAELFAAFVRAAS